MRLLKQIWNDIRQGKNVDQYILIVAGIVVAILSLLGQTNPNFALAVILAALASLLFSGIEVRHQIEDLNKKFSSEDSGVQFLDEYPDGFRDNLRKAKELWVVSVRMSYMLNNYYSLLETVLKEGATVRVLLVNPDDKSFEYALGRSYASSGIEHNRAISHGNLEHLCGLQSLAPDRMEIRTVNSPLTFGASLIDPDSSNGMIYLKHYAHKTPGGAKPAFVLTRKNKQWYDFFRQEIGLLWNDGSAWVCS
ncbi:MAG: hypothetical protein H6669_07380 [Ardenticatenaceae bacterium]|nr:hypothetical protein [Ardenticatenaceae bacterium]